MAVSPARVQAYEILLRVDRDKAFAAELLHGGRLDALTPADRGLATEIVMGVLRWQSLLDARIAAHSSQKLSKLDREVRIALRIGAYQLLLLERVPSHAAVHESVELVKRAKKRSAAPFANAVLRKLAASPKIAHTSSTASDATSLAAELSHPEWLVARWAATYGIDATRAICEANQQPPQAALRLASPEVEAELIAAGVELAPGLLLASARRVRAGDVTATAAFREGRCAIQDEASQLVALLVGEGQRILDCCAAPGGKTAAIAGRNPQARIVAAELHQHRAELLRSRIGHTNVDVLVSDARQLPFASEFDRVLADVPCSGTGTLAANPEIKWTLKPEDLPELQSRQAQIVSAAFKHLLPGGRLVYSTCSLEPEEGEQVVEQVLASSKEFEVVDCAEVLRSLRDRGELAGDPAALVRGAYLRTLPGRDPCEGFFAAVVRRK